MMDEEKAVGNLPQEQENNLDETVKRSILPYLKDLSIILTVILIVFLLCFRIAVVKGSSMYNTLVDGDYVLLLNNVLAGKPEYGDIIVASKSSYKDGEPIIKRVIATEGQTVDIDFEKGIVYVDGVALDEQYIYSPTTNPQGTKFPLTVEDGCVFAMGDNRGRSMDSRDPIIGQIDRREIVGRAIFILFPGNDEGHEERQFNRIGVVSQ